MSRGAYAGQPLSFRCSKCKKGYDHKREHNCGMNIHTTGKLRKQAPGGMNYHHWPHHAYQYKCLDCGHIGWSRHPSVQRIYREEHTKDLNWTRIKMLCAQGKRGQLDEAGLLLCEDAMNRDPEKYSEIKRKADQEVIEEMRRFGS